MSMQPIETWNAYDWRPAKAAAKRVIDEVAEGNTNPDQAVHQLRNFVTSIPGIRARDATAILRAVRHGEHRDARRLVASLPDRIPKPWVGWAGIIAWLVVKVVMLVGLVWLAVWLVR